MAIVTDGSTKPQPFALHATRFAAIYYTLVLLYWPLSAIPGIPQYGQKWMAGAWLPLLRLVSASPNLYQSSGGSDSVFDWLQSLCALMIAAAGVMVWRFALPRPLHPEAVQTYLRLFLRFLLATVMLQYGVMKPWQFPAPSGLELSRSLGSEVPMGLLWNFVGASRGYTMFTGIVEVAVGLLMLSPRTTLLGACLGLGVTLNILALNVFYDVPVKLFSLQLLVASVLLIAPDAQRLFALLLCGRATAVRLPLPRSRWAVLAEALYGVVLVCQTVWLLFRTAQAPVRQEYEVRGLWDVVSPAASWRQVTIDEIYGEWMSRIDLRDGKRLDGPADFDGVALTLPAVGGSLGWQCRFVSPDDMVLTRGATRIELKRNDRSLSLMSHRIHWIQDPSRDP